MSDINQLTGHTLLLVQFSSNEETRTYLDCQSPDKAFESFMRIFENFLMNKKGIVEMQNKQEGDDDDKDLTLDT